MSADHVVALPHEEWLKPADTLFVTDTTAWLALAMAGQSLDGVTVVHGVPGGLGSAFVHLAVVQGSRVVATVSTARRIPAAVAEGAANAIPLGDPDGVACLAQRAAQRALWSSWTLSRAAPWNGRGIPSPTTAIA